MLSPTRRDNCTSRSANRYTWGDRRFDLAFAVRVGLFHRDPERAHELLRPWLAPGARVRTFFDVPV